MASPIRRSMFAAACSSIIYAQAPSETERDAILARLGIDPRRPFVVIGTITPRYFANNIDIVDIVNEAVERGQLPAESADRR